MSHKRENLFNCASIYYRLTGLQAHYILLVLYILLCLYKGSLLYSSIHWIYYTELFCSLSVSHFSLSLSPYSQHGIRAIFLWFSLGKIRRSSAFTGSRSLPQDRKLRESYNALVDGLISFPLNIPGTTFHTCLQVLYYILTITLMIGEKQIQDQIFFLGLTNNFFKVL